MWRTCSGPVEIALVHRPRYDDWTLPKGKLRRDEPALVGAVREVREETGSTVAVTRRLGAGHYSVSGVRKDVTYWAMRHSSGDFEPSDEVDELAWLSPAVALERLSYDLDRAMLRAFTAAAVPEASVILVRHAKAGKRNEWRGDDAQRPLDVVGEQQAVRLVTLLSPFAPTHIVSASLRRCVQTVTPLARALGLTVTVDPEFADENFRGGRHGSAAAVLALGAPGAVTVVCSQGGTIPAVVRQLAPGRRDAETRKAAAWVLPIAAGQVLGADYYDEAIR